jgi:hypothetical protein
MQVKVPKRIIMEYLNNRAANVNKDRILFEQLRKYTLVINTTLSIFRYEHGVVKRLEWPDYFRERQLLPVRYIPYIYNDSVPRVCRFCRQLEVTTDGYAFSYADNTCYIVEICSTCQKIKYP